MKILFFPSRKNAQNLVILEPGINIEEEEEEKKEVWREGVEKEEVVRASWLQIVRNRCWRVVEVEYIIYILIHMIYIIGVCY